MASDETMKPGTTAEAIRIIRYLLTQADTLRLSRSEQRALSMTLTAFDQTAPRSTPQHYHDLAHAWDSRGMLWCYSEPADVWNMRETSTPAAMIAPYSARSYQRLVAEFGPLHPYEGERDGE